MTPAVLVRRDELADLALLINKQFVAAARSAVQRGRHAGELQKEANANCKNSINCGEAVRERGRVTTPNRAGTSHMQNSTLKIRFGSTLGTPTAAGIEQVGPMFRRDLKAAIVSQAIAGKMSAAKAQLAIAALGLRHE